MLTSVVGLGEYTLVHVTKNSLLTMTHLTSLASRDAPGVVRRASAAFAMQKCRIKEL